MTLALSLFFIWLSLSLMQRLKPEVTIKYKLILVLLVTPLVVYPFLYGPVWWLRGLTGDLSILSLCLLALAVFQQLFGQSVLTSKEKKYVKWGIGVSGLFFYPLALGLGAFDPYALGYANSYLVGFVLIVSLALFIYQYVTLATILLLCILAWQMQLLQSMNLWDYVMDPFVFFLSFWRILRCK